MDHISQAMKRITRTLDTLHNDEPSADVFSGVPISSHTRDGGNDLTQSKDDHVQHHDAKTGSMTGSSASTPPSSPKQHNHTGNIDVALSPLTANNLRRHNEIITSNKQQPQRKGKAHQQQERGGTPTTQRRIVTPSRRLTDTTARDAHVAALRKKAEERAVADCTFRPNVTPNRTQPNNKSHTFRSSGSYAKRHMTSSAKSGASASGGYIPIHQRVDVIVQEKAAELAQRQRDKELQERKVMSGVPEITPRAKLARPTEFSKWDNERRERIDAARRSREQSEAAKSSKRALSRNSRELLARSQRSHPNVIEHAAAVAAQRAMDSPLKRSGVVTPTKSGAPPLEDADGAPCTLEWWLSLVHGDASYWVDPTRRVLPERRGMMIPPKEQKKEWDATIEMVFDESDGNEEDDLDAWVLAHEALCV
eukprot:PhM_4_TR5986/c0_g1_i1/m.99463